MMDLDGFSRSTISTGTRRAIGSWWRSRGSCGDSPATSTTSPDSAARDCDRPAPDGPERRRAHGGAHPRRCRGGWRSTFGARAPLTVTGSFGAAAIRETANDLDGPAGSADAALSARSGPAATAWLAPIRLRCRARLPGRGGPRRSDPPAPRAEARTGEDELQQQEAEALGQRAARRPRERGGSPPMGRPRAAGADALGTWARRVGRPEEEAVEDVGPSRSSSRGGPRCGELEPAGVFDVEELRLGG